MGIFDGSSESMIAGRPLSSRTVTSSKLTADWLLAVLPCRVARGRIAASDTALVMSEMRRQGARPVIAAAAMAQTGYDYAFSWHETHGFAVQVRDLFEQMTEYHPPSSDLGPQRTTMGSVEKIDIQRLRTRVVVLKSDMRLAMAVGNISAAKQILAILIALLSSDAAESVKDLHEEKEKMEEVREEIEAGAEGEGEEVVE